MGQALALADHAATQGEVPVGAVAVHDGRRIGCGWNQVITLNDPSAHAEVVALRRAAQALGNYRLEGVTLYVTLEPCPMCAGALVHARIERLVFATADPRAGSCGSLFNLCRSPLLNHRIAITAGVENEAAREQLQRFFQARR